MSTETKSLAAKITPGKAFIDEGVNGEAFVAVDERNLADFLSNTEEEWANARLYAEAHNVANETGMTPRELLAKLREAKQLLEWVREYGAEQKEVGMGFPDFLLSRIDPFLTSLTLPADER